MYYSLILIKSIAVFWNTGGKGLSSGLTQRINWNCRRVRGKGGKSLLRRSVQMYGDCRCLLLTYPDKKHCDLLEHRGERSTFRLDARNLLGMSTRPRKRWDVSPPALGSNLCSLSMPLAPGRVNPFLALVLKRKMIGSHSQLHTGVGCTDHRRRRLHFVLVNNVGCVVGECWW